MKKIFRLTIIILFGLLVSGCGKEEISTDVFESVMKEYDYYVIDAKSDLGELDYISNALIAVTNDCQIEFYELIDKEHAATFYGNNKVKFDSAEEEKEVEEEKGLNYVKYIYETENSYKVIEVVGKTVVYLNVDISYKDEMISILNSLGY